MKIQLLAAIWIILSSATPTVAPSKAQGQLAFISYPNGNDSGDIYIMNADGSNRIQVTKNAAVSYRGGLAISPDRKVLAFSSESGDHYFPIFTVNLDGSDEKALHDPDGNDPTVGIDLRPNWSPDGKKIIFSSNRDTTDTVAYEPYLMNPDGSGTTKLLKQTTTTICDVVYSPDGKHIAYIADFNEDETDVYIMNSDGSNQVRLTTQGNAFPWFGLSWSPDSKQIAFTSNEKHYSHIFLIDVKTTKVKQITMGQYHTASPSWSPDGNNIAFISDKMGDSSDPQGNSQIYIMKADGTDPTKLTSEGNNGSPIWLP